MNNKNEINKLRKEFMQSYKENDIFSATENLEKLVKLYSNKLTNYEHSLDLYNLGLLYQKSEKYLMCQKVFQKVIKLLEKKEYDFKNQEDLKILELIIDTKNSLGICYNKMGALKYNLALECFKEALNLSKVYFEENKKKYLKILHNIGCLYYDLERYEDAIYYHLEELSLRQENSQDFIDNLNFLGYDYEAIENYEISVGYFKKALEMIKGIEGINSEDYMNNTYYLASVFVKMCDYEKAIKYYKKACNCIEQRMGEKHQFFAQAISNLANCYIITKKFKEALNLQIKANKITEDNIGKNSIIYSSGLKKIGDIHYMNEEYEKSILYYKEEVEIQKSLTNEKNKEYINSVLNLINVYIKLGKEDYKIFEDKILNLIKTDFPKNSYKKVLLTLVKIYIENNSADSLYKIFEYYKEIDSTHSFDEMLKLAENIEEDILYKEKNYVYKNSNKDTSSLANSSINDFKAFLEDIKREISQFNEDIDIYEEIEDDDINKDIDENEDDKE